MITVLHGGTQTLIQDRGRSGHRSSGIPDGGAADRLSMALANFMLGNQWDAPVLECAMGGLHLRIKRDTMLALAGAEMWAQVNGQNVKNISAIAVKADDILTLSFARHGVRAYIALPGGVTGSEFLGSVSTYPMAGLGGLPGVDAGRALKAGDIIRYDERAVPSPQAVPPGYAPYIANHVILRARSGPEFDDLSADSRRHLFTEPFFATPQTDRMGARLRGNHIETDAPQSLSSGPLLPGTLQVPPDGQPILALVDGHCTGGYARALQIITADQWLLGQIGPSSQISFRRCFADEAATALRYRNAFYAQLIKGFRFS